MSAYDQAAVRSIARTAGRIGLLLSALTIAGCGSLHRHSGSTADEPDLASIVAQLPDPAVADTVRPLPEREAVIEAYRAIEGQLPDAAQNQSVARRLADLEMGAAEDRAAAGDPRPYAEAIRQYTELLERVEGPEQAELLYHLARACDLAGDAAAAGAWLDRLVALHPDDPLVVEARFRRAERAFSDGRFAEAERDYAFVVDAGADSAWWLNAAYMSGWARLRNNDPDGALTRFFTVLDRTLGGATAAVQSAAVPTAAATHSGDELLADTLRATTIALGDLEGPTTLAQFMIRLDHPDWQFRVYEALAAAYLERERYLDSVATWQTFIDGQPLDPQAPRAHRNAITILQQAEFPTEARESEARFVAAYGLGSEFWTVHDASVRESYLPALKTYLDDLARTGHAAAQATGAPEGFAAAARWYEALIETFPDDPDVAGYLFLLGELRTEAGDNARAVIAYQRVMREFPAHPQAAEAGYAAVLGLQALVDSAGPDPDRAARAREHIAAEIEFADRFPGESRAPAVSAAAADGLYALGDHAAAVNVAANLLNAHADLDPALRATTLTVLGHGQFELGAYADAESAYRALLETPLAPEVHAATVERLQASIYRQAEASERSGNPDAAVANYLRLGDVDPNAELAIKGQYDAIAVLETAGRPGEAARLLDDFRIRHPDHALAADAPRRLAGLYEETGESQLAAAAWRDAAGTDGDPEVRRQALYRAAELELDGGDPAAAARDFAAYVEQYARPADLKMEALEHLDVLAQQAGAAELRQQWMRAKVALEQDMRRDGADPGVLARATQLAAAAQYLLGVDARNTFDGLRLVNPLTASLERKQHALQDALAAFEATAAYQVADYVTASTWQIADLYRALAGALMDSERPDGLSPAELEQYNMLLEEQAFPFEEEAISLHEINVQRSREGLWDEWIARSFAELGRLVPARFDRPELGAPQDDQTASAPGASPDARAALEQAVAADPGNCAARTDLALLLRREGAFGAAEENYLACLAVHPDFAPARLNLGILYELYLGRPDDALDAYQRYQALEMDPDPRVASWMQEIERRRDV